MRGKADISFWNICTQIREPFKQGCISCGPCSCPELTEDHVLPSAYVEIFRTVTRNAVNKSFWRKKDCSWPPLNKYAMNIWLSSLKIRAHLSWRTGKHLHVLHVLRTYSTCSCPGQQDTTTYAALHTGPTFRSRFTKKQTNNLCQVLVQCFFSPCFFVSILGRFRHFESCVVLKGRKGKIVVARKENTRDYPFVP